MTTDKLKIPVYSNRENVLQEIKKHFNSRYVSFEDCERIESDSRKSNFYDFGLQNCNEEDILLLQKIYKENFSEEFLPHKHNLI